MIAIATVKQTVTQQLNKQFSYFQIAASQDRLLTVAGKQAYWLAAL